MTHTQKQAAKLILHRDTIRRLSMLELTEAAGGGTNQCGTGEVMCPTTNAAPTDACDGR